jgi:anhydro-N-acetylmuramic acid kinase
LTTICDFRKQDVKLGGQGAPLVPIGDKILFSDYTACLNLGGFANISKQVKHERIAYDICSVNLVFNYLAQKKSMLYDINGELARSGNLLTSLFDKLNKIDFYNLPYPKSLGIEWNVKEIYPIIEEELKRSDLEDVIHTYLMHIVLKITDCFQDDDKVLVTGGGALNKFLIEILKSRTKADIILPSRDLINYKEALIFGLLGLLRFLNINNCLSSVTGASRDHCSGNIFDMK